MRHDLPATDEPPGKPIEWDEVLWQHYKHFADVAEVTDRVLFLMETGMHAEACRLLRNLRDDSRGWRDEAKEDYDAF